MQIQSKIWVLSYLWLGLQVNSSHGLHCFDCRGCSQINWGKYSKCADGEVCSKDIVFYEVAISNKTTVVSEIVKRSCEKYNPDQGVLNDCVWKRGVSPPYPGIRCLCNDSEFCNRAVFVSTYLNVQLLIYMLCLQVTLHALI